MAGWKTVQKKKRSRKKIEKNDVNTKPTPTLSPSEKTTLSLHFPKRWKDGIKRRRILRPKEFYFRWAQSNFPPYCIPVNSSSINDTATTTTTDENKTEKDENRMIKIEGMAIFCLHEIECKWFQGHFIPTSTNFSDGYPNNKHEVNSENEAEDKKYLKPKHSFGLLAKERDDVDACLYCSDGGYKELDLQIISHHSHETVKNKKINVKRLVCTGGDMMKMRPSTTCNGALFQQQEQQKKLLEVEFDSTKIYTQDRAFSYMKQYFSSLLAVTKDGVFPDCAIVIGNMSVILNTAISPSLSTSEISSSGDGFSSFFDTGDKTNIVEDFKNFFLTTEQSNKKNYVNDESVIGTREGSKKDDCYTAKHGGKGESQIWSDDD